MDKLNKLEKAILVEISGEYPELKTVIDSLVVYKRELSGAGSFTHFEHSEVLKIKNDMKFLNLVKIIEIPGLKNGMGAHLELEKGIPDMLEIYTFGSESWDGKHENFSFK